jgi:hypothetical protein
VSRRDARPTTLPRATAASLLTSRNCYFLWGEAPPKGTKVATTTSHIATVVVRSRRVYLGLAILLGLGPVLHLAEPALPRDVLEGVVTAYTLALIYVGLRRRQAWTIPLLRQIAAIWCVILLASVLYPAADTKAIIAKVAAALLCLFCAHQVIFFGRRAVRQCFGDEGRVLY